MFWISTQSQGSKSVVLTCWSYCFFHLSALSYDFSKQVDMPLAQRFPSAEHIWDKTLSPLCLAIQIQYQDATLDDD